MEIKSNYQRDLALKNNLGVNIIPQVMTCDADEFLFVVNYIQSLGYDELNWNLGCPYPMVTNRGMGSGLIADPEKIDHILKRVHNESNVVVSMKMRMGYDSPKEILKVFPVLDKYPIKNVAIHARIGKQLYKGGVDLESFNDCLNVANQKIYYNGDLTSVSDYHRLKNQFPKIQHWMIGRGLLYDPFLPSMIKQNSEDYPSDRIDRFKRFHDILFAACASSLSGDKQVIMKMLHYWEYFAQSMSNTKKVIKKVKKCKTIEAYDEALKVIYNLIQEPEDSQCYA